MQTPDQKIKSLENEIRQIRNQLTPLLSQNIDINRRRVINASPSHNDNDYIIRRELFDAIPPEVRRGVRQLTDLKQYQIEYNVKRINYGSLSLDNIDILKNGERINISDIDVDGLYVVAACVDEINFQTYQYHATGINIGSSAVEFSITFDSAPTNWEVGFYVVINNRIPNNIARFFAFEIFLITAINGTSVTFRRDGSSIDILVSWFGTPKTTHDGSFYFYKVDVLNFPFEFKSNILFNPSSRTGYAERADLIIPNVCCIGVSAVLYNQGGLGNLKTTCLSTGLDTPNQWESGDSASRCPGLRTLNGAAYLLPTSGELSVDLESDWTIRPNDNSPIRCLWGYVDIAPVTSGSILPVCTIQIIEINESTLVETVIETIEFYTGQLVSGLVAYPPETRQLPYNPKPNLVGDLASNQWPIPALKSNRRYKSKVTAIGSNTPGSNLIVVFSS